MMGCKENPNTGGKKVNFWIKGKLKGATGLNLYLEAPSENGMITVMSGTVDSDESIDIEGNIAGLGFYQLRLGENKQNAIPVTPSPGEHLALQTSSSDFLVRPKLTGTKWGSVIGQYLNLLAQFRRQQEVLMGNQQMLTEEEFNARLMVNKKPITDFVVQSVNKDPGNPANLVLAMELFPMTGFEGWNPAFLEVFKEVVTAYKSTLGEVPATQALSAQYDQLESGYNQYEQIENGEISAPNFALTNSDGKAVQLTDFRGKLVLIDFWASWCGPCRQESPNMVRIFNKFKNRNFTILSVSLDEDPVKWKEAIAADGLVWKNHVSDLRGWKSGMPALYGFDGIPFTVLVNPEGKIIARGLRNMALEQKINAFYTKTP
ncbi:MAG: TlpA family protein disulfide reductase [Bacteroidota bacterium]